MKFTRFTALAALVVGAALLTACAGAGDSPDVEGRTYISTQISGFEPVAGTEVTLSFSGNQVSARAGCNTMFGDATWAGSHLDVTELAVTEMGCEAHLAAQDQELIALLTSEPDVTVTGTALTMAGEGTAGAVQIDFEELLDAELEGTAWNVTGLEENEAVSSLPQGVTAWLRLADGQVEVDYGCNTGGGPATVGEGTIEFGPLIATLMACADEAMAVENHLTALLSGTVEYEIDGETLRLTAGGQGVHLRAERE